MGVGRAVHADVVHRHVFNFRMDPDEASRMLPVPWLEPAIVDGSAIFSFCPYILRRLTVGRVPAWLGLHATCAAYRLAVVERTSAGPRPSVWVPGRSTNSRLVSWGSEWWIRTPRFDRMSRALRRAEHNLLEYERRGATRFRAVLGPGDADAALESRAFAGEQAFACFMDAGTTSVAPGRRAGDLVRIDLDAAGTRWAALPVVEISDALLPRSATFESAFIGRGGSYVWTFAAEMRVEDSPTPARQSRCEI